MYFAFLRWDAELGYRRERWKLPVKPRVADMPATPPWLISVNYRAESHGRPDHATAVGTLISDRHVLTVAHVFQDTGLPGDPPEDVKQYFVRAGGRLAGSGRTVPVKAFHTHPDFTMGNRFTADADLAVLELEEPLEAPPLALGEGDVAAATPVRVLGARGPDAPNFVGIDTVTLSTRMIRLVKPKDRQLGIVGGRKDTNFGIGFSGGPVILTDGDEERVIGVVSYGVVFHRPEVHGQPSICADVTKYRQWINQIIGEQQPGSRPADANSRQPQP